jgi:hypothetical protein
MGGLYKASQTRGGGGGGEMYRAVRQEKGGRASAPEDHQKEDPSGVSADQAGKPIKKCLSNLYRCLKRLLSCEGN